MAKTRALGVVLLDPTEQQKRRLSAFIRCILPGSEVNFESVAEDIDGNKQCVPRVEITDGTKTDGVVFLPEPSPVPEDDE